MTSTDFDSFTMNRKLCDKDGALDSEGFETAMRAQVMHCIVSMLNAASISECC